MAFLSYTGYYERIMISRWSLPVFSVLQAAFALVFCVEVCRGQLSEAKLLPGDGTSNDGFGWSVSISGEYAVIGAYGDNSLAGAVYVFELEGTQWIEKAKVTASDQQAGDWFGYSVAIDSDYIVAGAPGNNSDLGAAYVFQQNNGDWTEVAKIVGNDVAPDGCFGWSVSISGDHLVAGVPDDDGNGAGSGSAYVFRREGVGWVEVAKLTAADGEQGDEFGSSVALSVDYAVVGAPLHDVGLANEGKAYVFGRNGSAWTQEADLTEREPVWEGRFGSSVAVDDNRAAIGSRSSGQAHVYVKDSLGWRVEDRIRPSGGILIGFGRALDIVGDHIIVGAELSDLGGQDAGCAYLFRRFGSVWVEESVILASDADPGSRFASAVALSPSNALVGSYLDNDNGSASGSAYIYEGFLPTEPISARITSSNSKVVIPPEGGTFDYTMYFANNTALPQNTDVWIITERPGPPPIVTFGPRNKTFGSSVSVSKDRSQEVPGNAAAGEYNFILYVGTYPDNVTDSDTLTFTKMTAERPYEVTGLLLEADNYPNPFNPSTTIRFSLPEATRVSLKIFNTMGQEVTTLVSGELGEGVHQVEWNASESASGIYFYVLQAQDLGVLTRKILLIK